MRITSMAILVFVIAGSLMFTGGFISAGEVSASNSIVAQSNNVGAKVHYEGKM
jgi:hypothetical protein